MNSITRVEAWVLVAIAFAFYAGAFAGGWTVGYQSGCDDTMAKVRLTPQQKSQLESDYQAISKGILEPLK